MARKFDPATFWKGIRLSEMNRLARAYALRIGEVLYLRHAIIDLPFTSEFDPRAIAFLDALARDVRLYFQNGCPDNQRFEGLIMNEDRRNEHEEIWATIRREKTSLINSANMVRAAAGAVAELPARKLPAHTLTSGAVTEVLGL